MRKIKVGVIGCGGIANGKHLPSLKKVEEAELVAFCDIVRDRAEAAAKNYGVPDAAVFEDYHDLLTVPDIEIVHVCTPNSSHSEISIAALEAGKHVMCEKPMAHTAAEARKMVAASKRTGKKLTIGYQTRSNPQYQLARRLIKEGLLGDIYYCKAPQIRRRGVPTWGVFLDYEKQGGGPMIDIGTHGIDAMMYMIGNYDVASVTGSSYRMLADTCAESNNARIWTKDEYQVEDSSFGFIRFKNGCTLLCEATWAINLVTGSFYPTICGSKAGLEIRGDSLFVNGEIDSALYTQEIKSNKYSRELYKGEDLDGSAYEARQWIHSVINGTEPLVKAEEALVVSEVIEAIYKSSESGKTIYFD